ncbi:MAG: phospholipase D family protein [bacterium]|nr:phospholipase D family protein [bacterium]
MTFTRALPIAIAFAAAALPAGGASQPPAAPAPAAIEKAAPAPVETDEPLLPWPASVSPSNEVYMSPFGGYAFANFNKKIHLPVAGGKEVRAEAGDLSRPLVQLLKGARQTIDIAMYIHSPDTAEHRSILGAMHRGVRIRLFLDSTFLDKFMIRNMERYKNKIYVKALDPALAEEATGIPFSIMHEKFGIIDGRHVFNGSANIDINANLKYTENRFFFLDNPAMVKAFQEEFDALWEMGNWLYNPDEERAADEGKERKDGDL